VTARTASRRPTGHPVARIGRAGVAVIAVKLERARGLPGGYNGK
jgi:hypothetical protein